MNQDESLEELNSDETFAFLNILDILSDTDEFRQWLENFHKIDSDLDIFEGYKFAIITSLRAFMNSLSMHDPFKLKDDEICNRAEFRGIKLEKLPNSCEKIVFQKNVWDLSKQIRKSREWNEIDVKKELSPLFNVFQKVKEQNIKTEKASIDESLKFISEFYAYLFLIDTSHGRPKGYYHPFFSLNPSLEISDKSFKGYAYTLQYFWYKVLGEEEFKKSCLKDLHKSQEVNFHDEDTISMELEEYEIYEPEYSEKEKKEIEYKRSVFDKWNSIDQFFKEIRKEIIWPLEKKIETRFGGLENGLIHLEKFDREILKELLDKSGTDEPEFMKNQDPKSIRQ